MELDILEFKDGYAWLSNFCPVDVILDGVYYPSTENAYQAAKTLDFIERQQFTDCHAGKAKRLGKKITIRDDWNDVKYEVIVSNV